MLWCNHKNENTRARKKLNIYRVPWRGPHRSPDMSIKFTAIQKDTRTHIPRAHFHHQFSVSTKKGPYNNGEAIKDDIKFENIKILAVRARVCARAWTPRMDYYEFYVVCFFRSFLYTQNTIYRYGRGHIHLFRPVQRFYFRIEKK